MGERVQSRTSVPASLVGELAGASIESISLLDGLVQDAARALFETYGVRLELDGSPVAKTLRSVNLISMIGFSSQALSGSLLLALPDVVVEHTLPAPDAGLADWSGELANQLLGRLKNQLLKYQVVINLSLPVVVSGGGFSLPSKTRQLTRYFSFVCDWGRMFIRMDMELCPSIELVRQADARTDQSVDEGELLLF
jgi:Chemotaxis phosphatase CheX